MTTPAKEDRFSRQVLLPSVGKEGQEKWAKSSVLLAGEGPALQAAATAFASTGLSKLFLLTPDNIDSFALTSQFPNLQVDVLPEDPESLPSAAFNVVLTEKASFRRRWSRWLRHQARPALFGWPVASGYALFLARHAGGQCPCLDCFEVMNPKAFAPLRQGFAGQGTGTTAIQQTIGALAASEALQWILAGKSPLEGKVWITSLASGVSIHHEVRPTYKCHARLIEEGAVVTP